MKRFLNAPLVAKIAVELGLGWLLGKPLDWHRIPHSSDIERTMSLMNKLKEPINEVAFSSVIEACIRIRRLDQLAIDAAVC